MPVLLRGVKDAAEVAAPLVVVGQPSSSVMGVVRGMVAPRHLVRVWKVVWWPFGFVLGNILSGNWVPSGPWIAIWSLFAFAAGSTDVETASRPERRVAPE